MRIIRSLLVGFVAILLVASVFGTAIEIEVSVKDESLSGGSVAEDDAIKIENWHDLDAVRDELDGDYVLMSDLDENTDGYEEYNNQKEIYEVDEDAGMGETWDEDDTIDIPFDQNDYDSVLSVEDEDGNPISHTVNHPTIIIDEDTGERYVYITYENAIVGWDPIGDFYNSFGGSFDGNGQEITDLYIKRFATRYVGLFGALGYGAEVNDVGVVDLDVSGNRRVGGLAGWNPGAITDSYVTGDVSGSWYVGGLVGYNNDHVSNSYAIGTVGGEVYVGGLVGQNWDDSTIKNSYATSDVSGDRGVGGLVGYNRPDSMIKNSHGNGNVRGTDAVGGLVGRLFNSKLTRSYATGNVNGDKYVGGLVGWNNNGTVSDSYATTDVSGEKIVGGLVGQVGRELFDRRGEVIKSYSAGEVSGDDDDTVGGLVGLLELGQVNDSFWDMQTTGHDESDGGTGLTTEEMKDVATYTDTGTKGLEEPWDFVGDPYDDQDDEDIWDIDEEINDGYPFLTWQDLDQNELTIEIEGQGSVEVEGQEIEDGWTGSFGKNEEVYLTAIAEDPWYFKGWTGDHVGTSEEITITMDSDMEITAVFEEDEDEEEDDGVPGFTSTLLLLAAVIAVAIYHKKEY